MRYIKSFENDAAIQSAVDNMELGKPYVALNDATGKIDWNEKDIDYSKMPITFEITGDGLLNFKPNNGLARYSINDNDYVELPSSIVTSVEVKNGDKVVYRPANGESFYQAFKGSTAGFIVYGKLMYGLEDYAPGAREAFANCTGLTDASNLILSVNNGSNSYGYMFSGCTSLTGAPSLPSMTLANNCYASMFRGCTSLEIAPDLPATIPASNCYIEMFRGCTSLKYIRCLTENISTYAKNWLFQASTTGTFVKKAGVTWESGASGIPSGWTIIEE